ncbi:MAG: AraC family transcriptional regulator [Gluconacetobacter diazotrophicus]|nr:AraC family transcriptional regulator [Gluconacetobacter diazotrophicus]
MRETRNEIKRLIAAHGAAPRSPTAIAGLTLFNCPNPTAPKRSFYEPRLCVVVQGRKRVTLGGTVHDVDATGCLLATIDLPVMASVTEADPDAPHLALTLSLDRVRISEVLMGMARRPAPAVAKPSGLVGGPQEPDLLDPLVRLLHLLDRPADIAVLAPMIEREILYRLLQGGFGGPLSHHAGDDALLSRVGRATAWIRANYHRPLAVAELASRSGMSATSLHRHFRLLTGMTPLQYRRELRLTEARRRILSGWRAGDAAAAVGYDSPSQFNREYRRSFGLPPIADAAAWQRDAGRDGNAASR